MTDRTEAPVAYTDSLGQEWIDLTHPELDGARTRIPNHPEPLEAYQARGWEVAEPLTEPEVSTPAPADADPVDEWIELVHPELEARHLFPNNPVAIAGAAEVGWIEPNKDGTIPSQSVARRRARQAQAATEPDPPHPAADPATENQHDQSAGESSATTKEG